MSRGEVVCLKALTLTSYLNRLPNLNPNLSTNFHRSRTTQHGQLLRK